MQWLAAQIHAQRTSLFPWVPVFFGIGIGVYFSLRWEPSGAMMWAALGGGLICFLVAMRFWSLAVSVPLVAMALVLSGFFMAAWRANDVAAPVLGWRYYGVIEGRVVAMDRSASDALRITLDQVHLDRISQKRIPDRVRISLHGAAADGPAPEPGQRVMTTGHLSPPNGPVEPGGFDFQRHAWFLGLGAVGYTRVPVLVAAPPEGRDWRGKVFAARMAVSERVQRSLPGDLGGFAAAVTAGDRSGIGQEALKDLRASNLAHLLAISGLHMGLLTGFVFTLVRFGGAAIPWVALHLPIRSIAASAALIAGAAYLALSGGNVATERAFIMAAVALCAVMLNRRVLSLRTVAVAAVVVLVLRPEAMLGPGFQMSFAATTALVAVFAALRDAPWRLPKFVQPVSAVFISSGVAGLATAPFATAHFNAIAHYGLLANVLSVPTMGILVVPSAVLAALLAPFGLADVGLTFMGWGLRWILFVADYVAGLPGARSFVPSPGPWVLPLLTLGAAMMVIWTGRGRVMGVPLVAAAFAVWFVADRPAMLVADSGSIVGVMTDTGRALSKPRGAGFVANNWLENDGDGVSQDLAFSRWQAAWPGDMKPAAVARIAGRDVFHITGKKAAANPPDCGSGVLISNQPLPKMSKGCLVFAPDTLRETGAVALRVGRNGSLEMTTARNVAGDRIWSNWPKNRDQ